jgi:hypothetical protein
MYALRSSTFFHASKCFTLLLCGALALTLAACDSSGSDEDDSEEAGTASVEITGDDVDRSYEWEAVFGAATNSNGDQAFSLFLGTEGNASTKNFLISWNADRPDEGDYEFANIYDDEDDPLQNKFALVGRVGSSDDEIAEALYSKSGPRLTIDASSEDRLEGSFELDGILVRTSAEGQLEETDVTITGTFEASGTDFDPGDLDDF